MREVFEDKLRVMAEDDAMSAALRYISDLRIEKEKPEVGEGDNNTRIGEKYRAYSQAKEIINKILLDIDSYNERKVGSEQSNRGK